MTCVLASPWNPLSTTLSWSSMNQHQSDSLYTGLERTQSHGYASSGSEQPKKQGSSTKKRASRAGTRSVSTLSAAQLERKRANDREAQRAIRQRTKDHIDGLENTISELRRSQEVSEKTTQSTRQRNRELEEENSYMRMKLNEAGLSIDLPLQSMNKRDSFREDLMTDKSLVSRPQDHSIIATHASSPATQASGASIQRPASTSTSRSFSASHPAPSGSWPQQQQQPPRGSYSGLTNLPLAVPGTATAWRSHEGAQGVTPVAGDIHTTARSATSLPYNAPHAERTQWSSTAPQYQYAVAEQQSHAQYPAHAQIPQQHAAQQQSPYSQAPLSAYPPAQQSQQQQPAYHPPQMPPQSEFQNLSVSGSTSPYTVSAPGTQSFVPQPQYHIAPMQSTEYQPPSHLPTQPMAAPSYQHPSAEQGYPPQQAQAQTQYRDDSGRAYSMAHYPPA
jgi:hypothetical protein